jgi:type IV pilus assembly protein PilV
MRSGCNSFHQRRHCGYSAGFTLLEVLIALVVLSIGLLGIAALQGVGLRSSHGAYLTSQASLLAYDMADRIRTNPNEFATTNLAFNCPGTTTTLASGDLGEWSCAIEQLLPEGSATITRLPLPLEGRTNYSIEITWRDLQSGNDDWSFELAIDIEMMGTEPEIPPATP